MKRNSLLTTRLVLSGALLLATAAAVNACSDPANPSVGDFAFSPDEIDDEIVGAWTGTLTDIGGADEAFSLELLRSGRETSESIDAALSSRLQCGDISRTASTSFSTTCLDVYETRLNLLGTLESDVTFDARIVVEASYSVLGKELPTFNGTIVVEMPRGEQLIGMRDDSDVFTGTWTTRNGDVIGAFTMERAASE